MITRTALSREVARATAARRRIEFRHCGRRAWRGRPTTWSRRAQGTCWPPRPSPAVRGLEPAPQPGPAARGFFLASSLAPSARLRRRRRIKRRVTLAPPSRQAPCTRKGQSCLKLLHPCAKLLQSPMCIYSTALLSERKFLHQCTCATCRAAACCRRRASLAIPPTGARPRRAPQIGVGLTRVCCTRPRCACPLLPCRRLGRAQNARDGQQGLYRPAGGGGLGAHPRPLPSD